MQNNQVSKQTAIKAALIQMTATQGWGYVKQLANNLVQVATVEALEEEDSSKRDAKVLKASALRKGFMDWFISIEQYKQYTETEVPELSELEGILEENNYAG
jgi:hypothetical protein